jgi:hypothetical protein
MQPCAAYCSIPASIHGQHQQLHHQQMAAVVVLVLAGGGCHPE